MKKLFNFVVLDLETTGFDFRENEIIEIGAVRYKEGNPQEKFSLFIKPKREVPQFIKQLTHITDEQLASGISIFDALKRFRQFIGEDILICHNADFDLGFLNTKLHDNGFPKLENRIFDTVEISKIYLPFIFNHKLGTIVEYFKINLENAHRAIYDAEATGQIFLKLLEFIDKNISVKLNYRLMEISQMANLNTNLDYFLQQVVAHQNKYALLTRQEPEIDFHNKNYISYKPEKEVDPTISQVFETNGLFSKKFENYEIRDGQIEMSKAVLQNFQKEEYLLVEAGTGVGKTLAYLIPAIKHSNKNNAKIIISTNTKNLQEQLFYKDLPTVGNCVDIPFTATLLKGRSNYICEKKWAESSLEFEKYFSPYEAKGFLNLIVWKEFTQTGDISENTSFNTKRDGSIWKKLSADRHFCQGKKCSFFRKCYLMDIRKKAEASNLVIINHHLLLNDMKSENAVLGNYENLIIDEAHNLPHIASSELGLSLGYADINNFFSSMFATRKRFQTGMLPKLKADTTGSAVNQTTKDFLITRSQEAIDLLENKKYIFSELFKKIGEVVEKQGRYGKLRIKSTEDFPFINSYLSEFIEFWKEINKVIMAIRESLSTISSKVFKDYITNLDNVDGVLKRLGEFNDAFHKLYNPEFKDFAFWLENFRVSDEKYPNGILNYAPLNVNQLMNDLLYKKVKSIVFTSATIAIRGKFKYFAGRMGLDLLEKDFVQEKIVPSPFDFDKQAIVLVSGFLPEPRDRFFSSQSIDLIKKSVEISKTGTMVLFTSYKDLNKVYEEISETLYKEDIPLLAQGKGIGRTAMLKEFKQNKSAVLLGTNSFWEGIDVPGESLSLLILYKLPFLVPSEPITEAYLEKLRSEGKDSFMHYMLPNALLKYRQGFGRLIRNKTDKGLVLVLDNRILTKYYGKYFKETVPAKTIIPVTTIEIYDHIGKWFKEI